MYCGLTVRPRAKVTIDSLYKIGTKMNDIDVCLEVYQGHVNHCVTDYSRRGISRKPLEKEAWFQRPPIGNGIWADWAIKWSRDR